MASSDWVAVAVGGVSAVSAWLAGRSAKKASEFNTKTSAETEAYVRARQMDVQTLDRQEKDLKELRENYREVKLQNDQLRADNLVLHEENAILKRRVARLEELLKGEEK